MNVSVDDVVTLRSSDVDGRGLNRMLGWSFAIHVGAVVAALVVPRSWFEKKPELPPMTISLGGSVGPTTTGSAPIAGKTVEKVTPPPPRPEPARPPEPKADNLQSLADKIMTSSKVSDTSKAAPNRPPVTGPQPSQGNARTVTPSRTEGAGLSSGGGLGGERVMGLDANFCCMAYVSQIIGLIDERWLNKYTERGTSVVTFEILRDGTITGIVLKSSSGNTVLDRAARGAVMDVAAAKVLPLPQEYKEERLIINLKFPYGGSQ